MESVCRTYYAENRLFHGEIGLVMGTRLEALLVGVEHDHAEALWARLTERLAALEHCFNRFDAMSEVSRLNRADGGTHVKVSTTLGEALRLAYRYWEQTEGLFDVTLDGSIRTLRIEQDEVEIPATGLQVDFGGFAKGYALREMVQMLREGGIRDAVIDFGHSSIAALGRHPYGPAWRIALPTPDGTGTLAQYDLHDTTLSTSGNRPEYTGHIIDPRTGARMEQRMWTTIVAEEALDAEVLSTVWMIADEATRERIKKSFKIKQENVYLL